MVAKRYSNRNKRRSGVSGLQYFRSRKNSIAYFLLFLVGLCLGSFYAVADGSGSLVLISIVINSVRVQQNMPFLRIVFQSLTQLFGLLVYLYFAAYCLKGKWLIYMIPLGFGLSAGATMTSILHQFGAASIWYLLLCVFVPKFLEVLLFLVLCNNCLRISSGLGAGNTDVKGEIFWVFAVILSLFSLFESLLILRFCSLLTLGI